MPCREEDNLDGSAIKGERNSCGKGCSRDFGDEVEDGGPNVDIRGFIDGKT